MRERDQQLARHRAAEVEPMKRLSELFAPPPDLESGDRAAEQARLEAEANAKAERAHATKWRANLKQFAPIERWECAWSAAPSDSEWPATSEVQDWLNGGCKKHLVIIGAVGVGKSIAAAAAVKHWVEPGERFQPVSWLRPDQLVSAVMHSYDPSAPKLCRYVVLDDMGRETKTDFAESLCDLLDRQGHTLIITSNLAAMHKDPSKTFRGRYDERLISRMNDTCRRFVVPGGDRRSKAGGF
jgi:DNA replication protein DnaC